MVELNGAYSGSPRAVLKFLARAIKPFFRRLPKPKTDRIRVGKANYSTPAGFGIVPHMEIENETIRKPRGRFSAEEKARVVGQYKESGLTRAEFCRREGVSLFNLQRWLWKAGAVGTSTLCGG